MDILTNSKSKVIKNNALGMLSNNSNVKIKKEENSKINLFNKNKIYNVKFYFMYNQNFSKEEEHIFKSFDYFTRSSKNKIKSGTPANFHIIIGKELLKDATYIFSIIPQEEIIINSENKFTNVCMIHISYSAKNSECNYNNMNNFYEFPIYHLEFNTNKSIKFCPKNDETIKSLISLITENSVKINKNNSLSNSGSILRNENVNYNNEIMNKKNVFETKSIKLEYINGLYYKLMQKNEKNTLFIKKELINSIFQNSLNKSIFLKRSLFNMLEKVNNNFVINENILLNSYFYINGNKNMLKNKSMENYGNQFLEFYRSKKNEFKSDLLKKYLMALFYIENLKHRNSPLEINSNIINNSSIKEFQNSYYLGFDLEYILINHLKSNNKNKSLLIPYIIKYETETGNKYVLYYLYLSNKELYLYEIMNTLNDRNIINRINNKVEMYFKRIFDISFISKAPLKYSFKGLVRKNMEFKLNFLDENKLINIYSHLHLFYKILNPNIELKQIIKNKATDEMIIFITLLLEL